MTVSYKYRAGGVFGWFQCEDEDFKKFFKSRRGIDLVWVVVLRGGEIWVWSHSANGWYKKVSLPWWCPAT